MSTFIETPGIPTRHEVSATALSTAHENADKIVLITSVVMTGNDIFRNGLYQNIYMLYELIEALGYKPYILVEKRMTDVSGAEEFHANFRVVDVESFVKSPFRVYFLLEVALGLSAESRRLFKTLGARTVKLYLGNTLNIDTEIPTCMHYMTFSHHQAGEFEEIWTSPHYAPNVDYTGVINSTATQPWSPIRDTDARLLTSRIVPYVWSPRFIQDLPRFAGLPATGRYNFTIIEPNISFQKCSLIPLLIIESIYRQQPELVGEVVLINSDKLCGSPYFQAVIKPRFHLERAGKIKYEPRRSIIEIVKTWPTNIVVANQILNEYNYIMMEHLFLGFPYVHNCASLNEYGYYYEGMNIDAGVMAVKRVIETHTRRQGAARAEAAQITWRFSPYNPEIIAVWSDLLSNKPHTI